MKKINVYITLVCLLAISLSTSCTKESELSMIADEKTPEAGNEKVSVIKGVLVFQTRSDMHNYLNKVATNESLEQQELELGFISLYAICKPAFEDDEKLWDSYENLNCSKEEFFKDLESGKLAKYSNTTLSLIKNGLLKINYMEDNEEFVDYSTTAPYLVRVLNNKNLVCINDTIYQYNENNIKIIPNRNFDLIEKLESIKDNDKQTGVIVAKESKEKTYYYPTTVIDCASGSDQSGTSLNSKKLKGYLRIKHYDYITNEGLPWYYHAYYIQAYTYLYKWNFGWYWKPVSADVNMASCYWTNYFNWQGWYGSESYSFISETLSCTGSAGGTRLLYAGDSNSLDLSHSAFQGSVILQRIDDPAVMFTLAHSKVDVPSRWW